MACWLCGIDTTNAKAATCNLNVSSCRVCTAVAQVDEEINQALAALRRLLAKRCDLRSEQNNVHAPFIRRLPAELKTYIFELLLPPCDEWGECAAPQTEITTRPTHLASVCRGWRDIAWTIPSLWSTIHIPVGALNSTSDPSSRISFLNDWILRSRAMPLRIVLCDNGGPDEEFQGVIDAIGRSANRWHSLSLDVPWRFNVFSSSNFQCHRLKRLRMIAQSKWQTEMDPLPFRSNVSPEKIELRGIRFQSLQISWNHLTTAKVESFGLEETIQLFQHALQMTCCHILSLTYGAQTSTPLTTHHRLEIFSVCGARHSDVNAVLLSYLTLPSLQEFHTDEMALLNPRYLPALIDRSSCPLSRLTFKNCELDHRDFSSLQPLPGVTDVFLESSGEGPSSRIKELVLDGYFPDMRHLTLPVEPFLLLWDEGSIFILLGLNRPPNQGRLKKLRVVDQASAFNHLWNSSVGDELRLFNISVWDDGFELICFDEALDSD